MESFGCFLDQEWECLSKMFSDHFSSQGLNFETPSNVSSVITECTNANSMFTDDHGFCYTYENINPNFSLETSNVVYDDGVTTLPHPSSNVIPFPTNGVYDHEVVDIYDHENNNNSSLQAQFLYDYSVEETLCLRQDMNIENSVDPSMPFVDQLKRTPLKRKIEISESHDAMEDKVNDEKPIEKPKKRTRVSKDNKNKQKVQPKKKEKVIDSTENGNEIDREDNNNNKIGNAPIASSSSCTSEDDLNGGAENSNWKTRAGRGAATDPQSLYARKRREKINERLKVLQKLVPNGSKVDISTMLEEAVKYVKFLQLQIKLLSSDEMWMYAPIAYNGIDMGLYQKLSHS